MGSHHLWLPAPPTLPPFLPPYPSIPSRFDRMPPPHTQVVNRSAETLQNLCLELATMGDLKLVERPQNYTLAPGDSKAIRANIKAGGRVGADTVGNQGVCVRVCAGTLRLDSPEAWGLGWE